MLTENQPVNNRCVQILKTQEETSKHMASFFHEIDLWHKHSGALFDRFLDPASEAVKQ